VSVIVSIGGFAPRRSDEIRGAGAAIQYHFRIPPTG
jgi:hypothetical protein